MPKAEKKLKKVNNGNKLQNGLKEKMAKRLAKKKKKRFCPLSNPIVCLLCSQRIGGNHVGSVAL
jgi:hypothetical protein